MGKLWARSKKEAVHKFRVIIERLKEEAFWRDLSHYFEEVNDA